MENTEKQSITEQEARDFLRSYITEERKQCQVAKELGVSDVYVSRFMNGNYPAPHRLIPKIQEIMLISEQKSKTPKTPKYVTTSVSREVFNAITYSRIQGRVSVVYGDAGIGKTMAIEEYCKKNNFVIFITVTAVHANISGATRLLAKKMGIREKNVVMMFEEIVSRLKGSDRVVIIDEAQHALLVLYGTSLGDDENEVTEAAKVLRENKLLELPEDAKAEYLSRSMDENGVEVLRKAIKEDIYTFSHVPNLTDDNFAGNSSGVAMEYKLLGLEMVTKIKTRYYKVGLRKRIKLFCHYLGLKNIMVDADSIVPSFARTLPKNLLELSQIINNLEGTISERSLVKLLPFVEDPDAELAAAEEENKRRLSKERELFGNSPPVTDEPEREAADGEES
ncbi:MAG: phage portal protein [Lachnospiraceae bacterium]